MTLKEAIDHARAKAAELGVCECARDHIQLAEWLEELQVLKSADPLPLAERLTESERQKIRKLHAYWGDCMRRYSPSTRREYRSRQMGVEEIFGKELFNGKED